MKDTQSKSTDKLIVLQEIIGTLVGSLSQEKLQEVQRVQINWTKLDDLILPNLNVEFFK